MRKLFTFILSVILVFMMGTTTLADIAISEDQARAYELIERTNAKINEKIEKAVEEADKLQEHYLLKLRQLQEEKKLSSLKKKKGELLVQLSATASTDTIRPELEKLLQEIETKIYNEEEEIEDYLSLVEDELKEFTRLITSAEKINSMNQVPNVLKGKTTEDKLIDLNNKYTEKLLGIISRVYEETLRMSTRTIDMADKLGVQAECSWVLIRFADKEVWIDPIKVVGV